MASKAPQNVAHLHHWIVDLTRPASRDEVLDAFRAVPRIAFIRVGDGISALNVTAEVMKEIGRSSDMWEVAIWEDILTVEGRELFYAYQVDNQAIVVPETIDAIRALCAIERSPDASIRRTGRSAGNRRRISLMHTYAGIRSGARAAGRDSCSMRFSPQRELPRTHRIVPSWPPPKPLGDPAARPSVGPTLGFNLLEKAERGKES